MKIQMLSAWAAAAIAIPAFAQPEGYAKVSTIAVQGYSANVAHADFPVLVRLSSGTGGIEGFSYDDFKGVDGSDLVFTSEDGETVYPHEIDTWNTQGESLVWVKLPSLVPNAKFKMWYGNPSVTTPAASCSNGSVWSAYIAVWHMNSGAADSGAQHVTPNVNASAAYSASGKIGGCYSNGRVSTASPFTNYSSFVDANTNSVNSFVGSAFTVSGWFNPANNTQTARIFSYKDAQTGGDAFDSYVNGTGTYMRGNGTGKTAGSGKTKMVAGSWSYFTGCYVPAYAIFYINGEYVEGKEIASWTTDPSCFFAIGGMGGDPTKKTTDNIFGGDYDEFRIYNGRASKERIKADYDTVNDTAFLSVGAVESAIAGAPVFALGGVTMNGDGTVSIAVSMTEGASSSVALRLNSTEVELSGTAVSAPWSTTYVFTPAADTTYSIEIVGMTSAGVEEVLRPEDTFYSGTPSIVKTADAEEDGFVSGFFTFSRASMENVPLTVAYTIDASSTAVADVNYEALPGTVVIPAGAASATVEVVPLVDGSSQGDTTLVIVLASGAYFAPQAAVTASMTITKLGFATGYNTWNCPADGDGLASSAANWSLGRVPQSTDKIMLDGRFSNVPLVWTAGENGLPDTVAEWVQQQGFTATNTISTTFASGAFPRFTVTGDMRLDCGALTHAENTGSTAEHRLSLRVNGNISVASGAALTAYAKGFTSGNWPEGSSAGSYAASNAGYANVWGSLTAPDALGSGCIATQNRNGGGAIWIECDGAVSINGLVDVRALQANGAVGSAGSVYISAASCSGAGMIRADAEDSNGNYGADGSGGRVAIVLSTAGTLDFPSANVFLSGVFGPRTTGGGTFYSKTAAQQNGTLHLQSTRAVKTGSVRYGSVNSVTAIPAGQTWTLDSVEIIGAAMLAVPAGTSLVLPNGPVSVTAVGDARTGGIIAAGGTIEFGNGPYVISSPWVFQAKSPYAFNGDLSISNGGAVGCLQFEEATYEAFSGCSVTVNGNMTVDNGGYVWAENGGPDMNRYSVVYAYHGGQTAGWTEGDNAETPQYMANDSVFAPSLPGPQCIPSGNGNSQYSTPGGGVVKLNVAGALTVNGKITAEAVSFNGHYAISAGGSIDITAATLSGTGSISANCQKPAANNSWTTGGGGRVAVKLTSQAVGTDGIFSRITASGAYVAAAASEGLFSSSAGTVYLEGLGDAERGGKLRIFNDGADGNLAVTPFPATGAGADEPSAFKKVSLEIGSAARVRLMANTSVIKLTVNDTIVPRGKYTASELNTMTASETFSGDGILSVGGYGFTVIVR